MSGYSRCEVISWISSAGRLRKVVLWDGVGMG